MFGTLLCAAPALQLKAWESLQTKTAAAAAGYTLRDGLVPSSAPQATIPLVPHGDVDPETIVFYRDTNAWCPFCERVWLALEAKGVSYTCEFVDLRRVHVSLSFRFSPVARGQRSIASPFN